MNTSFESSHYSKLMTILGVLLVALLIFWAGTVVGGREARFSHDWEDNYMSQFGGQGSPFVPNGEQDDSFGSAHGAFGEVVGVRLPAMIVKGPTESEKTVIVGDSTVIRRYHAFASTTDIVPGETVLVIGEPDDHGDIQASFIRIVPTSGSTTNSNPPPMAPNQAQ